MTRIHGVLGLGLGLCAACGSDGKGPTTEEGPDPAQPAITGEVVGGDVMVDGFEVPAPAADEIQFVGPVSDLAPSGDETFCHYLDWESDRAYDITDYRGFQSEMGHHVILFSVPTRQGSGSHPCTEMDMISVRYLAAGGSEAGAPDMPEGIVLRLEAGMQLMVQDHWINYGTSALRGQSVLNVKMEPARAESIVAGLFTAVTTQISVNGISPGTARAECTLAEDLAFFTLGGHMHDYGKNISVTFTPAGGTPTNIYETAWEPHFDADPPRNGYTMAEPFLARAGDTFTVDCAFENPDAEPLTFPKEMCVMWGYYFPATRELNCVNGVWPAP